MCFCFVEMGLFYFDIIKDCQYIVKVDSVVCCSCQIVLYYIVEVLVCWMVLIMFFMVDEIWGYLLGECEKYVFIGEWYDGLFGLEENEEFNDVFWDDVCYIKDQVNKELENQKVNGIKLNLEVKVMLKYVDDVNGMIKKLKLLGEEVRFIFIIFQFVIFE